MDKSLLYKYFLSFGAGVLLASIFMVRTPTIQEKTIEVSSTEDMKTIESLRKELHSEKYTSSVLKSDLQRIQESSSNVSKDIEETTTIVKPDGTKIVTEKKDKSKSTASSTSKESVKVETQVVEKVVEKEVIKYIKQEEVSKTSYSKETEFTFNSSVSLGLGIGFDFDKGSFEYNFLSAYQFSPMFGIYSSISLSTPYANGVESMVFGFTLNF